MKPWNTSRLLFKQIEILWVRKKSCIQIDSLVCLATNNHMNANTNCRVMNNFADKECEEAQRFGTWFENLDFWDHTRNYMKPKGCDEELFVQSLFQSFEDNIILMVRRRCLPCFKKEVEGRSKLFVGFFYPKHWEMYKSLRVSGDNPGKLTFRSFYSPGFADDHMKERRELISWNDCPLPILRDSQFWWCNKWQGSSNIVWRSWITDFAIVWNSFNSTVYVTFKYNCQFYCKYSNKWVDH